MGGRGLILWLQIKLLENLLPPKRNDVENPAETDDVELVEKRVRSILFLDIVLLRGD